MVCMEAAASALSLSTYAFLPSPKLYLWPKPSQFSCKCSRRSSTDTLSLPLKLPLCPSPSLSVQPRFRWRSTVEEATVAVQEQEQDENVEEEEESNHKKKLYVVNIPWTYSSPEIKNHFSQCGTVKQVEIIKNKDGKSRGYAFVTMASGEEADAAIDKLNSTEILGRTIRVQYAKKLRPPRPSTAAGPPGPPAAAPAGETRHKLYVSNLQWKVRSGHLRELFSADFNPVSAKVVFDGSAGRPAGYGFVSFPTREEAEAALSSLNGKELLGRPVRLSFSEKKSDESGNQGSEQDAIDKSGDELVNEQPEQ